MADDQMAGLLEFLINRYTRSPPNYGPITPPPKPQTPPPSETPPPKPKERSETPSYVQEVADRVPMPRRDPRFDANEMRQFFAPQPQMQLRPGDELPFKERVLGGRTEGNMRPAIPPEVLMQLLGMPPLGHSYPDVLPPFPFDVQSEKST